jgi:light-regulated signal transduction histidine kinase (bacteriophytochrome)/CheY-like chemotaxis protein
MAQTASSVTAETVDLSNCDREPIHVPGSIQSHGVLLVCVGPEQRVAHASTNSSIIFMDEPEYLLGKPLEKLLGATAVATLLTALETAQASVKARVFRLELLNGATCHAQIIRHAGNILIELEPVSDVEEVNPPLQLVSSLLSRMQHVGTVSGLCDSAVERVRALIRYDRVMIYKFSHDGSGHVISEAKRQDLAPFLDLHYPASDIPQQARALYLKSWIRLIADVGSQPVPILPERDASGQPVDLTFAGLRSVSPIHIEYLKNMGVGASMSISIIVGGKLWGLVACHHCTPKIIPADIRSAAELFGQIFSLQLESVEPNDRADLVRLARSRIDKMLASFPTTGALIDNLTSRLDELRALIDCDGVGLWIDGIWRPQGHSPPAREIPALARFIEASATPGIFAAHDLTSRVPAASTYTSDASGLMAIPLSRTAKDYLMYFRKEVVRTVKWGGDPNKAVTVGPNGDRLTPRKSFESWESEVRGQSRPWEQTELLTAEGLRISLLEVVLRLNEVAARERAQASERQRLLAAELNHRVKNVLALVSALVARGQGKNETLTSFVKGLEGRIKAMAFAHDQVIQDSAGDVRKLIEVETSPYRQDSNINVILSGPEIALDPHAFSVLALVVHEMTTNAAKYGALSTPGGRLGIEWRCDVSGDCVIDWQESGGPAVQPPAQNGFGTTLIERQIPHELGGQSEVRFELTGVRARFVIPAKHVRNDGTSVEPLTWPGGSESPATALSVSGLDVLLVEDSLLIALDAEAMLRDSGANRVDVFGSTAEALNFIGSMSCQVAVLDINLGRGTSIPVADELAKRGIPFIFASGYTDSASIPERYRHVHFVAKPYSSSALVGAIVHAMKRES